MSPASSVVARALTHLSISTVCVWQVDDDGYGGPGCSVEHCRRSGVESGAVWMASFDMWCREEQEISSQAAAQCGHDDFGAQVNKHRFPSLLLSPFQSLELFFMEEALMAMVEGACWSVATTKRGKGTGRCNSQCGCHFDKSVECVANHLALGNEAICCLCWFSNSRLSVGYLRKQHF